MEEGRTAKRAREDNSASCGTHVAKKAVGKQEIVVDNYEYRMLVTSKQAGRIIGLGGAMIKSLNKDRGCFIKIMARNMK